MNVPNWVPREKWRLTTWLLAIVTFLLALFELFPVIVALRAGIAGLSIVIFTPLLIIAFWLSLLTWQKRLRRPAAIAGLAAVVALLAMIAPVLSLASVAKKEQVSLAFDLQRYVAFTGDSIDPVRTIIYKEADGQALHLAIYKPNTNQPTPTVLLLHGGGWQYGSYLRTNNWPRLLSDAGYQVISIEYRLASVDHPTWDKAPVDVDDAVSYIKKNAVNLGVAPDQIAILGQSAGGHLALLEAHKLQTVRAAIGLYAPTDLTADYELSVDKNAELAFLDGSPAELPERYQSVSAQDAVTSTSPPTLLIQGTSDDIVHQSSSTRMSDRLAASGVPHQLVLLPYTGHSFDNQVGGFATQIAERVVLDFLGGTLH